jgi:hypothetical protein
MKILFYTLFKSLYEFFHVDISFLSRSSLRASAHTDDKREILGFRIVVDAENWEKNKRILEEFKDIAKQKDQDEIKNNN